MAATVDPYLLDWLDLVFRWFHVIAAIAWIGASFYFVALDSHLLPPEDEHDRDRGVGDTRDRGRRKLPPGLRPDSPHRTTGVPAGSDRFARARSRRHRLL